MVRQKSKLGVWLLIGLVVQALLLSCSGASPALTSETAQGDKFQRQRHLMVQRQLASRDISDRRVLEAMEQVPRHKFVPESLRHLAYADHPLPIGEEQTISQPYIVALMTQSAQPGIGDRALEIGTGSGYQAAVLSRLVERVFTIEIVPVLATVARKRLQEMGYGNIEVRHGDGYQGWPEEAPFDIILITAAAEKVPEPLIEQLAEGGRLIMPLGQTGGVQSLIRVRKEKGKLHRETLTSVRFVPMTGEVQQ